MLKLLFMKLSISSKEISYKLNKEYNIDYSEQEVFDMSNLSSGIKRLGYLEGQQEGMELGKREGIIQGTIETSVVMIQSLIEHGFTVEQSMEMAKFDD